MSKPNYRIYPSLLDSFQRLLDADKVFEDFVNDDGEGGYKRSLEEISREAEQRLLDTINRVQREPVESADKGTCFNILVDWLNGAKSNVPIFFHVGDDTIPSYYEMQMNGFTFQYNARMAQRASSYFKGAVSQFRCQGVLPTRYGDVLLYGVIDEIRKDKVLDIKTTTRYQFGKFADHWQKDVYPYCLISSGYMNAVSSFEYTTYAWISRVGQPLDANLYREEYTYNYETSKQRLTQFCERFIEWLEANRYRITDRKIFGE